MGVERIAMPRRDALARVECGSGGCSQPALGSRRRDRRASATRAHRELADLERHARGGVGRPRRPRAAHRRARHRQDAPGHGARRARRRADGPASRGRAAGTAAARPLLALGADRARARGRPRRRRAARRARRRARWVAQLAPELRERLDLPEAGDLESEQARFALFDAVTVFLRNAAARRAARRAPRRPPHRRPAVAAAARLPGPGAERDARARDHHPPRGRAARAGPRSRPSSASSRASACASTSAASRTTTCARWSSTAAAPTPPRSSCTSLHTLTEGNPFYSDEVVRLLVAQGRIDQPLGERLPLPDGVRDAIRRRLLPLRPEVLEALQVAAVEGRDFELRHARARGRASAAPTSSSASTRRSRCSCWRRRPDRPARSASSTASSARRSTAT